MYVRDIMTADAVTAGPDERAADIARLLTRHHVNTVYIVGEDKKLLGSINQTSLLRHVFPTYQEFYNDLIHGTDFEEMEERIRELTFLSARDVMTPITIKVAPDMPVMKAAAWMILREESSLPVVADEEFCGVISRGDVFYNAVSKQLRTRASDKLEGPAKSARPLAAKSRRKRRAILKT